MKKSALPLAAIDWTQVSKKIATEPWAREIAGLLRQAFQDHLQHFPKEPPFGETAWFHFYFCNSCAVRLKFDPSQPARHACPQCGKVHEGEPWDGVWRMLAHGAAMHNLERAAILARLHPEEPAYRDTIRNTVLFYASHYKADYPVHGKHAGRGKILPQSLDESILFISLGRCLQWGSDADWFSDSERALIGTELFEPAVDLIRPQIRSIHNIHAWMQAMVATAAVYLGDKPLLDEAVDGEFGWRKQIEQGVRDDGFWWEGSLTYHFYSYSALASLARAAAPAGLDLFQHPKLVAMLDAPLGLAYPDGTLPAHNDCWYGRSLLANAGAYEEACALGHERFAGTLARMYQTAPSVSYAAICESPAPGEPPAGKFPRCSASALLFGPAKLPEPQPLPRTHRIFRPSGIAVLENSRLRICLRAHPDCGGHDHWDKLAVDVHAFGRPWSADFGTSGYGLAITSKWYRSAPAHNLVVVDETGQKPSAAELISWEPKAGIVSGRADAAVPGVALKRRISLRDDGWNDAFTVESEEEHTLDWCFHAEGEIEGSLAWEPVDSAGAGRGYGELFHVEKASPAGDWTVRWVNPYGSMRLDFETAAGTEVLRARCPGNPAPESQGILIVRRRTRTTEFRANFTLEAAA